MAATSVDKALVDLRAQGRAVPISILDLVEQFRDTENEGNSLNETSVRQMFIDPVLEALGWDPRNRRRVGEGDQDVTLEAQLTIDGRGKAPDYACRIGEQRKFFVEAKRPSVNVRLAKSAAYQIRRYCWSAGLPFGLLTDFQEFAIYDCRAIPSPHDTSDVGRIAYFKYSELAEQWPLLDALFGKDAVGRGSLELLAAGSKPPRNAKPIDAEFLEEIKRWRKQLAADIAILNTSLNTVELNEAVQTLIDRLVFLRVVESRGLEPFESLKAAVTGEPGIYARLMAIFQRADDRYNSGLFRVREHDGIELKQHLGADLLVSDEVLESIVGRLYYPEPYEFSVLPADILGRIYEQFLGDVITLRSDRTTIVEMKPDVRKAGGVYYTPTPIVDFIVDKTVGPLLAGKEPRDIAKLRIVDPACGSGSFLIAVYQYIIDWHVAYYADKPKLSKQNLELGSDGLMRLKTPLRKLILQNNIFGVDIDPQAVEVTKLSLLLKVVEGQSQLELDVGRILPDLESNVTCGNSLIGTDFQMPLNLAPEEKLQFNPFNWKSKWPSIMAKGGFDAVVGNPPYLNVDAVWGQKDPRLAYLKSHYSGVYADKTDLLFYFLQKAALICRGEIGYIVSRSFLEAHKAQNLRAWLSSHVRVREILDFRHAHVFPKVGINTAIVRLTKSTAPKVVTFRRWNDSRLPIGCSAATLDQAGRTTVVQVEREALGRGPWNFGDLSARSLVEKIDQGGDRVADVLHVGKGMETAKNTAFRLDLTPERFEELHAQGHAYIRARNSDIGAYFISDSDIKLAYPHNVRVFKELPVDVQTRLSMSRDELEGRAAFKRGNCQWWQYTWPLHKEHFNKTRIFCPYRASRNRFALDVDKRFVGLTDTTVLYDKGQPEDMRYILGILNSTLASYRFSFLGKLLGGGVYEYYENTVAQLRIPRLVPGDDAHDQMVDLVDRRMEAESDCRSTTIGSERKVAENTARVLGEKIDDLTENLFDLTRVEREILRQWEAERV